MRVRRGAREGSANGVDARSCAMASELLNIEHTDTEGGSSWSSAGGRETMLQSTRRARCDLRERIVTARRSSGEESTVQTRVYTLARRDFADNRGSALSFTTAI